jgi:hypothetical protein
MSFLSLSFVTSHLKWDFVCVLVLLETSPIRLDELQTVGNQLKAAFLDALIGFPFILIKGPDDCDSGSFVEIL